MASWKPGPSVTSPRVFYYPGIFWWNTAARWCHKWYINKAIGKSAGFLKCSTNCMLSLIPMVSNNELTSFTCFLTRQWSLWSIPSQRRPRMARKLIALPCLKVYHQRWAYSSNTQGFFFMLCGCVTNSSFLFDYTGWGRKCGIQGWLIWCFSVFFCLFVLFFCRFQSDSRKDNGSTDRFYCLAYFSPEKLLSGHSSW